MEMDTTRAMMLAVKIANRIGTLARTSRMGLFGSEEVRAIQKIFTFWPFGRRGAGRI
jgi:hypothetical protein